MPMPVKLTETEMPGVLKWALEGARKLREHGDFIIPKQCREALEEYHREALPEIEFLEENFEECDLEDVDQAIECGTFRKVYEAWCKDEGVKAKSQKRLHQTMRKVFPFHQRGQVRRMGNRPRVYVGIKMQPDSEFWNAIIT